MSNERTVDLVEYLPPFLAEYKELNAALTAENPEFNIALKAAERILMNEFVETADECGIARFERFLKIIPSEEDTLELRRARIKVKWFSRLPYTVRTLANSIARLCGDDFELKLENGSYSIYIKTHLRERGRVEELKEMLDSTVPANMIIHLINSVRFAADDLPKIYSGVGAVGIHTKRRAEVKNYGLE